MGKFFSGCLTAIGALVVLIAIVVFLSSHRSPSTNGDISAPASNQAEQPTFSVTRANVRYLGTISSDVGVAILGLRDAGPYLSDGFGMERADGKFVVVAVAISNGQNSAITMNTSLFEIVDSVDKTYSASEKSMTLVGGGDDLFLAQINPGVTKTGLVVFDVPQDLRLENLKLKFRGGMTGDTAFLPLRVNSTTQSPAATPMSAPQAAGDNQLEVQDTQAKQPSAVQDQQATKPGSVSVGQTETEVEAILGPPTSITTGAQHVYNYPHIAVVFIDGTVSEIRREQ
jgi:hypothetical protein